MGIEDRTVTGIVAVHGNIDDGSDRTHPGLFGDYAVNGRKRVVHLWQHDASQPPIATVDKLFEVDRADLPAAVRLYAPDATGATAVTRTYLDTPRGNEVLAGLRAGAISEMSYAYDPKEWSYEEVADRAFPVRNITRSHILDTSDVNWGMNPATSADGSKGQPLTIQQTGALAALDTLTKRWEALHALRVVKEGRRFSASSVTEIEEAIQALDAATTRLKALIAAPEPEKVSAALVRQARHEWQARQIALLKLGV
jgi:phage head maturation protease